MIVGFRNFNSLFVNCKLLFCVILLLNQPLNFLVMYVIFLYGLEPWNI
jgi:hypothetical protein